MEGQTEDQEAIISRFREQHDLGQEPVFLENVLEKIRGQLPGRDSEVADENKAEE